MIEALSSFPGNIAAFVCHGRVSQNDYRTVLVPAIEKALAEHRKVRLYYETAGDFDSIAKGAVWEDIKITMKHWPRWDRIAVVTDAKWVARTTRTFAFLVAADTKVFASRDAARAREWIQAP